MTTIATFTTPEEAHLCRSFLESRGIEAFLLDENMVQLFWYYSNALGGVRLAVGEEDAELAGEVCREYLGGLLNGPYPLQPVRAWPVVVLLSLVIGFPFLLFRRSAVKSAGLGN